MIYPLRHDFYMQLLKAILFILTTTLVLIVWGSFVSGHAQNRRFTTQPAPQAVEEPLYSEYKGIKIGMADSEVRARLGEPKELEDTQFFYVISERETAQIFFDQARKVKAISVDYIGEGSGAPECRAVMGLVVQPAADGSVYKLVRYPRYGYWVSYNRTAGALPIITVTIQKM
ncbi:MAG TPA: hypothetical protein VJS44_12850 [Pyrinomonadaceae bacterium]|nr:hypothetical protein [Pyrinomonadaceae bacterium]